VIKLLKDMLQQVLEKAPAEADRGHGLELATAALLVEIARADYRDEVVENELIFELLKAHFTLSAAEAEALLNQAADEVDDAVSLQGFTRLLHENLSPEEKLQVLEMLWRVAMADEHLDRHEDHLIRRVAELLYIPHGDVIRVRNRVRAV
jgi:uncharacterized tellurite resistance protein B-like protein